MKYYFVNTNLKADPSGHDEKTMLDESIVALYFTGYKERINDLQNGDIIFLYSNKKGIIAAGEVHGETCVRTYKGLAKFQGDEFFKKLKNFIVLEEPISSKDIKTIIGVKMSVLQAIFCIQDKYGQALMKKILTSNKLLAAS